MYMTNLSLMVRPESLRSTLTNSLCGKMVQINLDAHTFATAPNFMCGGSASGRNVLILRKEISSYKDTNAVVCEQDVENLRIRILDNENLLIVNSKHVYSILREICDREDRISFCSTR